MPSTCYKHKKKKKRIKHTHTQFPLQLTHWNSRIILISSEWNERIKRINNMRKRIMWNRVRSIRSFVWNEWGNVSHEIDYRLFNLWCQWIERVDAVNVVQWTMLARSNVSTPVEMTRTKESGGTARWRYKCQAIFLRVSIPLYRIWDFL